MNTKKVKDITPEVQFKKDVAALFFDDSPQKIFSRISCTVKNKCMFWYNHGYVSVKDIKNKLTAKYKVVEKTPTQFLIVDQPMKCCVNVVENYHTIEITFV